MAKVQQKLASVGIDVFLDDEDQVAPDSTTTAPVTEVTDDDLEAESDQTEPCNTATDENLRGECLSSIDLPVSAGSASNRSATMSNHDLLNTNSEGTVASTDSLPVIVSNTVQQLSGEPPINDDNDYLRTASQVDPNLLGNHEASQDRDDDGDGLDDDDHGGDDLDGDVGGHLSCSCCCSSHHRFTMHGSKSRPAKLRVNFAMPPQMFTHTVDDIIAEEVHDGPPTLDAFTLNMAEYSYNDPFLSHMVALDADLSSSGDLATF
eukprot:GFUD01020540.1.p1 GENE.GFUD01020540.1~~GFUD01020540.1.p1  ORF type:complete len:293 (+),score=76.38 GFUD01020540.1:91-879(+)